MRKKAIIFVTLLALLLTIGSALVAAPDAPAGGLSIPWWTVDGGGRTSHGGQFALSGTAGQPDAAVMGGGPYTLQGGFWNPATGAISGEVGYRHFLPVVRR
jgi:hypothetical protein